MKPRMRRICLPLTAGNRMLLAAEVRRTRKSYSETVRNALNRGFRTFEPQPTLGRIILEAPADDSSFNVTQALVERLEIASKGWRYSKPALFNALIEHALKAQEQTDEKREPVSL